MNAIISSGIFSTIKTYRSIKGFHYFVFDFVERGDHIDIYCTKHPSLNGQDSSVSKTHLYSSGKICFVEGKEPSSKWEAQRRAKQWAEYFLEYRRTGKAQK